MLFDQRLDTLTTKALPNTTRLVPLDRHRSAIRWQFVRGVVIGIVVSWAVAISAFRLSNLRQRQAAPQEKPAPISQGSSEVPAASRPQLPIPVPVSQPTARTDLTAPRPTKKTLAILAQLWASAEEGNPQAAVALADLYLKGEVVPVNCDQARVLLFLASKENDAEATRKLQELDKTGCPAR